MKILKEKFINFIRKNKMKVEVIFLALAMTFATAIPAAADINGNTIKNNLLTNFLGPIFIVILVFILIKEFLARNTAKIVITVLIAAFIAIFIYFPDGIKIFMNTIKSILGI